MNVRRTSTIKQVIVELKKTRLLLVGKSLSNIRPFNEVYIVVTQQLAKAITRGDFEKPVNIEELDLVFASSYFEALQRYQDLGQLTPAWQPIMTPKLPSFIYALLGANIHIGYDLTLAIVKTKKDWKLEDDFKKADAAIVKSIHGLLAAYFNTTTNDWLLKIFKFLYRWPLAWVMVAWRHLAWNNAERIFSGDMSPSELLEINQKISKRVVLVGRFLSVFGLAQLFRVKSS